MSERISSLVTVKPTSTPTLHDPIFVSSPSHAADVQPSLLIVCRENRPIMRKRSRNVVWWQMDVEGKTGTIALFLSPLVPLKGNELIFEHMSTCCGALYRIRTSYSLVKPQRNIQREWTKSINYNFMQWFKYKKRRNISSYNLKQIYEYLTEFFFLCLSLLLLYNKSIVLNVKDDNIKAVFHRTSLHFNSYSS